MRTKLMLGVLLAAFLWPMPCLAISPRGYGNAIQQALIDGYEQHRADPAVRERERKAKELYEKEIREQLALSVELSKGLSMRPWHMGSHVIKAKLYKVSPERAWLLVDNVWQAQQSNRLHGGQSRAVTKTFTMIVKRDSLLLPDQKMVWRLANGVLDKNKEMKEKWPPWALEEPKAKPK